MSQIEIKERLHMHWEPVNCPGVTQDAEIIYKGEVYTEDETSKLDVFEFMCGDNRLAISIDGKLARKWQVFPKSATSYFKK